MLLSLGFAYITSPFFLPRPTGTAPIPYSCLIHSYSLISVARRINSPEYMLSDPKLWLPPFHRIPLLSVDPSKVERTEVIAWINFFVLSCFHVCLVLNNFEPSYCRRPAPWQFIYISKSLTYSATGLSSKNDTIWTWLAFGCLLITSALKLECRCK